MKVRSLDRNSDWTFGKGRNNYIAGANLVAQKVATRIKSFKNDNPLNVDSNIDWIDLLGRKGTEDTILDEIERVTLTTEGVTGNVSIDASLNRDRVQKIELSYDTIYGRQSTEILDL